MRSRTLDTPGSLGWHRGSGTARKITHTNYTWGFKRENEVQCSYVCVPRVGVAEYALGTKLSGLELVPFGRSQRRFFAFCIRRGRRQDAVKMRPQTDSRQPQRSGLPNDQHNTLMHWRWWPAGGVPKGAALCRNSAPFLAFFWFRRGADTADSDTSGRHRRPGGIMAAISRQRVGGSGTTSGTQQGM